MISAKDFFEMLDDGAYDIDISDVVNSLRKILI